MANKMKATSYIIHSYTQILKNQNDSIKEYGDYIENYNKIAADLKNL